MGLKSYDFAGWATRFGVMCADGRTIRHGAFDECCGKTVPLIWNHDHGGPDAVVGKAYLEHRDDGVYCYGSFNDTEHGKDAKELVKHGDITNLSIYANHLKESRGNVFHGLIREVSLVLAGANPGAKIDTVLCHGDGDSYEETANIYMDDELSLIEELSHSDEEEAEAEEVAESTEEEISHADENGEKEEGMAETKTVKEIFDELTEEQKNVVFAMLAKAEADAKAEVQHNDDDEEGENDMKHNAFDVETENATLAHSEEALMTILADGKRYGSLKESFLAHAEEYGISNIELLFPDAQAIDNEPGFIARQPQEWVGVVMNGIHKSPFSKTKTLFADITEDEARAKGYIKGKRKKDEVFSLLKRTTSPTTIYKKQKLDRDDIVDIKDFNVVAWIKKEMRMMLDEEIARAILFGDGRLSSSDDKIDENCIRPVVSDDQLYAIKVATGSTIDDSFVDKVVEAMDEYQGSGNTVFFAASNVVTKLLLIKDNDGHRMYKNLQELANAMTVDRIVKLPKGVAPAGINGVILDLADYNAGSDKGGEINSFEDFDIDYNQQKYLMEGRMSGALRKPFSAVVLKETLTAEEQKTWKEQLAEVNAAG